MIVKSPREQYIDRLEAAHDKARKDLDVRVLLDLELLHLFQGERDRIARAETDAEAEAILQAAVAEVARRAAEVRTRITQQETDRRQQEAEHRRTQACLRWTPEALLSHCAAHGLTLRLTASGRGLEALPATARTQLHEEDRYALTYHAPAIVRLLRARQASVVIWAPAEA